MWVEQLYTMKSKESMQRMDGEARLVASLRDDRTSVSLLYQDGSAKIRFPARTDNILEAILINSAGGSTGGDSLIWNAHCKEHAHIIMTTQASEKIYRSLDGQPVSIHTYLQLDEGATLYWLPQETILFDRSVLNRRVDVDIADGCSFLMVESIVFGRQLMQEVVNSGSLHDEWHIKHNGELIHLEALHIDGNIHDKAKRSVMLDGNNAIATLLYFSEDSERLEAAANDMLGALGGVSCWNGLLIARLIDKDCYSLRKRLIALIELFTKEAGIPKIWSM